MNTAIPGIRKLRCDQQMLPICCQGESSISACRCCRWTRPREYWPGAVSRKSQFWNFNAASFLNFLTLSSLTVNIYSAISPYSLSFTTVGREADLSERLSSFTLTLSRQYSGRVWFRPGERTGRLTAGFKQYLFVHTPGTVVRALSSVLYNVTTTD